MKPFALSIPTALAAALAAATLLVPHVARAAACTPATVNASDIPSWKPPKITQGACTQTEANKFEVAFNASNATADTMEASVSAGCKQCIFSQDATSANWQVIVWTNRTNAEGIYNTASCLAAAGASQGCAGARYGADTCAFDACSVCTDQTSFETCNSSARGGECKSYADEASSNCDAKAGAAFTSCGIDPTDGTGSGVAKLVMQVCGALPVAGGGGSSSNDTGNTGTGNNGGSTNSGNDSSDTGNQGATNGGTPSKGSGGGAMSSLQLDGPPNTAGGCSASGASTASAQPIALALVGLLVAARRKRSARNASKK